MCGLVEVRKVTNQHACLWTVVLVCLVAPSCGHSEQAPEIVYSAPYTEEELLRRAILLASRIGHDPDCFTAQYETLVREPSEPELRTIRIPTVVLLPQDCDEEYSLRIYDVDGDRAVWEVGNSGLTPYQENVLNRAFASGRELWESLPVRHNLSFSVIETSEDLTIEMLPDIQEGDERGQLVVDGTYFLLMKKGDLSLLEWRPSRAGVPVPDQVRREGS